MLERRSASPDLKGVDRLMRIAIVIGVDEYDDPDLLQLGGAQIDADNVFQALVDQNQGQHHPEKSLKLLSPTLAELRGALQESVYDHELTAFTFFFAGHGLVVGGSHYLCLRDTRLDRLAASALSFSEILRLVGDAQPANANIIVDACQSGGVVHDLNTVINPSLLGETGTPSICVIAASMSNQKAGEDDRGGFLTRQLLRCVSGNERIQNSRSHLNLIEIGERISQLVIDEYPDQSPVCWGLNLFGTSQFCVNPHFEGGEPSYVYELANIPPASASGALVRGEAKNLWRMAEDLPSGFSPSSLIKEIRSTSDHLPPKGGSRPAFVSGLAQTLPQRASQSKNVMCRSEVLACCIVALLKDTEKSLEAREVMSELLDQFVYVTGECIDIAVSAIEVEKFNILSNRGGLSDLFFVPIRLSKLLGWVSALGLIQDKLKKNIYDVKSKIEIIIELYKINYICSLASVSEEQAPHILISFEAIRKFSLLGAAEPIIGCYVNDFVSNHGRISEPGLKGADILRFLLCRANGDYSTAHSVIRQPSELLSVLLKWISDASLDEILDPHMKSLDHESMNVFVPSSYWDFGDLLIEHGKNLSFQIGGDVGVGIFTVEDFRGGYRDYCQDEIKKAKAFDDDVVQCGAILASMLLPDRVPWSICTR